jgi:hypothetical protein
MGWSLRSDEARTLTVEHVPRPGSPRRQPRELQVCTSRREITGPPRHFWASLGFENVFESDHGSGQWQHPAGGPYVFIAQQVGDALRMYPVIEVADAALFASDRTPVFSEPFTPPALGSGRGIRPRSGRAGCQSPGTTSGWHGGPGRGRASSGKVRNHLTGGEIDLSLESGTCPGVETRPRDFRVTDGSWSGGTGGQLDIQGTRTVNIRYT